MDISYSIGGGLFIVCALADSSATGLSTATYPGISHTICWNSVENGVTTKYYYKVNGRVTRTDVGNDGNGPLDLW